jgi:CBS domain-containing protein
MGIESLMTTEILRTTPGATLAQAAEAMVANDAGSVLVFDAGDLVGVITERDIVRAALRVPELGQARVSDHMSRDPWVVPANWSARQVATRMINHGIQHAPVTRDGAVIGVVSSFDLLAYLALGGDGGRHGEGQAADDANPVEGSGR